MLDRLGGDFLVVEGPFQDCRIVVLLAAEQVFEGLSTHPFPLGDPVEQTKLLLIDIPGIFRVDLMEKLGGVEFLRPLIDDFLDCLLGVQLLLGPLLLGGAELLLPLVAFLELIELAIVLPFLEEEFVALLFLLEGVEVDLGIEGVEFRKSFGYDWVGVDALGLVKGSKVAKREVGVPVCLSFGVLVLGLVEADKAAVAAGDVLVSFKLAEVGQALEDGGEVGLFLEAHVDNEENSLKGGEHQQVDGVNLSLGVSKVIEEEDEGEGDARCRAEEESCEGEPVGYLEEVAVGTHIAAEALPPKEPAVQQSQNGHPHAAGYPYEVEHEVVCPAPLPPQSQSRVPA